MEFKNYSLHRKCMFCHAPIRDNDSGDTGFRFGVRDDAHQSCLDDYDKYLAEDDDDAKDDAYEESVNDSSLSYYEAFMRDIGY